MLKKTSSGGGKHHVMGWDGGAALVRGRGWTGDAIRNAGCKGVGLDPWDWKFSLFFRAFTLSGLVSRGVTARRIPGPHPLCCGLWDIIVPKAKRHPGPRLSHSNVEKQGGPPADALGGAGGGGQAPTATLGATRAMPA